MATKRKEKRPVIVPPVLQEEPLQDFLLRLPRSLHTQLKIKAAEERKNVRQLINEAIALYMKGGKD
jgi:predicted HicB family RNase H-like nuclease